MISIHHLTRKEIDDTRWNVCVGKSPGGLIYARTAYLDHMAPGWEALVTGDYDCVMPLTHKKKYGVRYLSQPPFCQQLGLVGQCTDAIQQTILDKAKYLFPFAEISLNFKNSVGQAELCNNFILHLLPSYEILSSGYSNDLRKNLARCTQFSLQYRQGNKVEECITLYRKIYGQRFPQVKAEHYDGLTNFCLTNPEHFILREVRSGEKLLSTVLCLTDSKRIYFLASTTLPEGRNMEANHFLVDNIIREFSGRDVILDFEGSDISGIAAFYKNFGAINQPYPKISWNRLKWPWSMFKK
jgi:hypothetical protein